MVSMREQIKKEFADSKVKRKAQRIELIKQARIRLTTQKVNPNATAVTQKKPATDTILSPVKKQVKKRQKQLNREIDLKHYDGSAADKLLDLVAEKKSENKELITSLLDKLWRKSMNGETLMGKDFAAIAAAKNFLREVQSKTS